MNTIHDGGPAFPREDYQSDSAAGQRGMTLRDYFAAKAMNGELAAMSGNPDSSDGFIAGLSLEIPDYSLSRLARHWFRIADAMLKAREL